MQLRQLEPWDQIHQIDQRARGRGKQIPGFYLIGKPVQVVRGQTGQRCVDGVGDLIRDLTTFMSVDEAGIRLRKR